MGKTVIGKLTFPQATAVRVYDEIRIRVPYKHTHYRDGTEWVNDPTTFTVRPFALNSELGIRALRTYEQSASICDVNMEPTHDNTKIIESVTPGKNLFSDAPHTIEWYMTVSDSDKVGSATGYACLTVKGIFLATSPDFNGHLIDASDQICTVYINDSDSCYTRVT